MLLNGCGCYASGWIFGKLEVASEADSEASALVVCGVGSVLALPGTAHPPPPAIAGVLLAHP
jgi:hypothetical protein